MKSKRSFATISATVVLVAGFAIGAATPASALSSGELTQACRTQPHGTDHDYQVGWTAHLYGSTIYDWKCFYNTGWPWAVNGPLYGINIQAYCQQVYGKNALHGNVNDPYSWYCG